MDEAMAGFISMLEEDKDHVPALLGMSVAFTLEDSPNKVQHTHIHMYIYVLDIALARVMPR